MTGRYTVEQIARGLGARVSGDGGLLVSGVAEPAEAGEDDLALAMSERYVADLPKGRARAAILGDGADPAALGLRAAILVQRPRYAMAGLTAMLDPGLRIEAGIHPSAVVEDGVEIGEGASIGPYVHIRRGARIGPRAQVGSHVSIGRDVAIGADATLHPGVRIGANVRAGDRLIAQPNASIGGDGFSFVTPERGSVEAARASLGSEEIPGQSWVRIHSLGSVWIGDDVEIGSCTTIDRGTIRDTRIGRGTKIDNLVMVGHNVEIGEDCLFAGQVGIAGSTVIGNRVVLGGKVGISDNIRVGDDVVAGGGTIVLTSVPAGRAILGMPAVRMTTQVEINKGLRRLPRLYERVRALEALLHKDGGGD